MSDSKRRDTSDAGDCDACGEPMHRDDAYYVDGSVIGVDERDAAVHRACWRSNQARRLSLQSVDPAAPREAPSAASDDHRPITLETDDECEVWRVALAGAFARPGLSPLDCRDWADGAVDDYRKRLRPDGLSDECERAAAVLRDYIDEMDSPAWRAMNVLLDAAAGIRRGPEQASSDPFDPSAPNEARVTPGVSSIGFHPEPPNYLGECPGCGLKLYHPDGVYDGQPLECGCDGHWSVDAETCEPLHDDECRQCARDERDAKWRLIVPATHGPTAVDMVTGQERWRVFAEHIDWVNKASSWMSDGDECFDSTGRQLRIGRDFAEATFPVVIARRYGVDEGSE